MLDFLRQEGIEEKLITRIQEYRKDYPVAERDTVRIPSPKFKYYGKEIWQLAITAILSGENILLVGPKATGKNVFAENLSAVFGRPEWDISFYLNTDASVSAGTGRILSRTGRLPSSIRYRTGSNAFQNMVS